MLRRSTQKHAELNQNPSGYVKIAGSPVMPKANRSTPNVFEYASAFTYHRQQLTKKMTTSYRPTPRDIGPSVAKWCILWNTSVQNSMPWTQDVTWMPRTTESRPRSEYDVGHLNREPNSGWDNVFRWRVKKSRRSNDKTNDTGVAITKRITALSAPTSFWFTHYECVIIAIFLICVTGDVKWISRISDHKWRAFALYPIRYHANTQAPQPP